MIELPAEVVAILDTGDRLAHLVTVRPDGSPHVTIVWTGVHDNHIVTGHLGKWQKLRNIERDPRVALSVETGSANAMGLAEYLVVEGIATIVEGGAPQLLQELAHRYIGPESTFPPMPDPPPGYTVRITPLRVSGVGPWNA